jgi:SAM-dependent methyltransferase
VGGLSPFLPERASGVTSLAARAKLGRRASTWKRVAANVKALAAGTDLLAEVDAVRRRLEQTNSQAEIVIRALIRRHYLGLDTPPPELRLHVGNDDTIFNFWSKGISTSEVVLATFGEEPDGPILDWGCGSGRTLLFLSGHPAWRALYHGCDVDQEAIAWLRAHVEQDVRVCGDLPPLPYADESFVGVFGFSVFTHIPPERHAAWYSELARVLRPGGLACVTLHNTHAVERIPGGAQAEYQRTGHVYVVNTGHYKSATIVDEKFTRAAVGDVLEVEAFCSEQDTYQFPVLLRKRA